MLGLARGGGAHESTLLPKGVAHVFTRDAFDAGGDAQFGGCGDLGLDAASITDDINQALGGLRGQKVIAGETMAGDLGVG